MISKRTPPCGNRIPTFDLLYPMHLRLTDSEDDVTGDYHEEEEEYVWVFADESDECLEKGRW